MTNRDVFPAMESLTGPEEEEVGRWVMVRWSARRGSRWLWMLWKQWAAYFLPTTGTPRYAASDAPTQEDPEMEKVDEVLAEDVGEELLVA